MATQLKCQTLYPEGLVEIALSAPDTVSLFSTKGMPRQDAVSCTVDMAQRQARIHRLYAWLVQYSYENGRDILRLTALEKNVPPLRIQFGKGSTALTLKNGTAVHDLQATGLTVEPESITVAQTTVKTPPTPPVPPTPKPSGDVQKLQARIAELEKRLALSMDQLRDDLKKKLADLTALNTAAAEEIEALEDQIAQAQRQQTLQEGELTAARQELARAQAACEDKARQVTQVKGDTAALEKQIEELQQKALERAKATRDLTEADTAALQQTLREQRQQYLAMTEALALMSTDPVIGCKNASDLLAESSSRLEEAQKRIAAIITLREKINDDVLIAVTGRGTLSVKAEAGEG